jgi:hypothetical protein
MEQGAPEPGRTQQAAGFLPHPDAEGCCPDIHRPPDSGSPRPIRVRGGEA